jgi:protein-disulfide isomerase
MTKETKTLAGLGLITLAILLGGIFFFQSKPQDSNSSIQPEVVVDNQILEGSRTRSVTSPDAKVTIVEFADFQCPACASAHPTVKQMLEKYKGKANFIFRHFPLPLHKNAIPAAYAAEAAGEQNKFWEMYDLLFQRQNSWSELSDANPEFEKYATELNLDIAKFKTDRDSQTVKDRVKKDQDDAFRLGVRSTPTFYVAGKKYEGALDMASFTTLIDQANTTN